MDGKDGLTERKKKRIGWWKSHGKQKSGEVHEMPALKSEKKKLESLKQQKSKEEPNQKEKNEDSEAGKKRYILFVGNLPFNMKEEEVKTHFSCTGGVKEFRLMTKKSGESKGCGFLELENQENLWKALKLNHSKLQGRKINVEVTCGGGGSGEERRNKLKRKKQRLKRARQKKTNKDKDGTDKNNKKMTSDKDTSSQQETKCFTGGVDQAPPTYESASELQLQSVKGRTKLVNSKKRKIMQKQKDEAPGSEKKKARV